MTLPDPGTLGLPAGSAVAVPVPPGGLTLYRLLRHREVRVEDFEPVNTRPQAQLKRIPELFWASTSHWLEIEQALRWSRLSQVFIARVELRPDPLIRVALTERSDDAEQRGHVDVWAYPRQLLAAVAEVTPARM